jgi:hypothetical protein
MAKATDVFKQRLEEATASDGPESLKGAAAIAINAEGKFSR